MASAVLRGAEPRHTRAASPVIAACSEVEAVKQYAVVLVGLIWVVGSTGRSSAQDTLTFSLDEVSEGVADTHGKAQRVTIEASLDGLQWGMTKPALLALLKQRIRVDFEKQIKAERDIVRQDALYQEAQQRYLSIRSGFVAFDGRKTGWDVSPLVDEFRHGSGESLLVVDDEQAREHYFFINGRLWKWYRELKPGAWDGAGADYDRMAARLRSAFGAAKPQQQRRNEAGTPLTGAVFEDERSSVTLLKRGAETCLVYEERATLAHLAMLREKALPRGPKQNGALDMILMTPSQREAWRQQQDNAERRAQNTRQAQAE
jgi:hypothetical protein